MDQPRGIKSRDAALPTKVHLEVMLCFLVNFPAGSDGKASAH